VHKGDESPQAGSFKIFSPPIIDHDVERGVEEEAEEAHFFFILTSWQIQIIFIVTGYMSIGKNIM